MEPTFLCLVGVLLAVASSEEDSKVTDANNAFAFRLLPVMSSPDSRNVFYSPFSVASALAMVYAGAEGATRRELYETLGYNATGIAQDKVVSAQADHNRRLLEPSNSTLEIANAAVVDVKLDVLPGYVQDLENGFGAEVLKVDYARFGQDAVNSINSWVSQKTHHRIAELFDTPPAVDTELMFLNAIYFKGTWRTMFPRSNTVMAYFYTSDGSVYKVDTMQGTVRAGHAYLPEMGASLLELPYSGLDYSMAILLPENTEHLESLRRGLSLEIFSDAVDQLNEATVDVRLPRFKLEKEYDLKDLLPRLGIKRVFKAGQADLSGVNGGRDLHVDKMVHKAVVEVNE